MNQLLGTSTKVRILSHLCLGGSPISRAALVRTIQGGNGPAYRQVDQLIALGVLKEDERKVVVDPDFPLLDDLTNLLGQTDYFDEPRLVLERLEALFGTRYYLTGYLAARQAVVVPDHEQESALVALVDSGTRDRTFLEALDRASMTRLDWLGSDRIPTDISRGEVLGAEVWLASIERGLVDHLVHEDSSVYAVALLTLQNHMEETLDWERLLSIASRKGVLAEFLTLAAEFNRLSDGPLVDTDLLEKAGPGQELSTDREKDLRQEAARAYNTLMGG